MLDHDAPHQNDQDDQNSPAGQPQQPYQPDQPDQPAVSQDTPEPAGEQAPADEPAPEPPVAEEPSAESEPVPAAPVADETLPLEPVAGEPAAEEPPAEPVKPKAKRTRRAPRKTAAAPPPAEEPVAEPAAEATPETTGETTDEASPPAAQEPEAATPEAAAEPPADEPADEEPATGEAASDGPAPQEPVAPPVLFRAPEAPAAPAAPATEADAASAEQSDEPDESDDGQPDQGADATDATDATDSDETDEDSDESDDSDDSDESDDTDDTDDSQESGSASGRRRRRRGGRRRRRGGGGGGGHDDSDDSDDAQTADGADQPTAADDVAPDGAGDQQDTQEHKGRKGQRDQSEDSSDAGSESTGSRRRRRRRRAGDDSSDHPQDEPDNTVTRVRSRRSAEDQITAISGSTRLEAKKQRRRDGREAGRRRAPIVSEAEFLARRESVERVMVVRQHDDLTQIAVLEDKVLVEHYVSRKSQTSLIGNVYLGRVQNVLPSMEAAFVDIGKGRNAVLYAGEVNWSSLGHKDGAPRKIESVLSSGQSILVQVSKDPMGHKGARLTSQVSLAGRFLVYVPDGTTSGISRKLPDTERSRLKTLLKEIVPDTAGVIVRTAAEGASEDELVRDVERLTTRWADIEKKAKSGNGPKLLYGEPDLTLKVVRDLFTEDFARLVIEGDEAWDTVQGYVAGVAPDLEARLERFEPGADGRDSFTAFRIDEQIHKGMDRKVWLPSGGSLVIDRTEAMTVVDVNTGKFTGSGGNLEETVTKNNLEAAEEIVRQLRLRDIGGIIVVDFIDMVLESNRDLVLRRLVECLGRDRTRHQVAEVTSLGLVQMTRKRIGTGLLEAFSEPCEACAGRGLTLHDHPVDAPSDDDDGGRRAGGRRSRGRGRDASPLSPPPAPPKPPTPADIAGSHPRPAPEPEDRTSEPVDDDAREPADEPVVAGAPEDDRTDQPDDQADPFDDQTDELPDADPVEPVESDLEPLDDTPAEPDDAPAAVEPAPAPQAAPEPAAPRVVTRTRRRSASRPAGPPTYAADDRPPRTTGSVGTGGTGGTGGAGAGIGVPVDDGLVEPVEPPVEPGADGSLSVPVKRRGRR